MNKFFSLAIVYALSLFSVAHAQSTWVKLKEELVFSQAPFKQCHASTMVEVSPGKILLACFGGSAEGKKDVDIWLSSIDQHGISEPQDVANGIVSDTLRFPAWNPVLFKTRNGKLFLFYKVGPNPREWWGMVKTSDDNGQSWSSSKRLPDGILGPIKNKPVQLADGTILSPSSVEVNENRWTAHIEKSADEGKTWTLVPVDPESKFDVIQPSILFYGKNKLQVLCRSKQGSVMQAWSSNGGNTWGMFSKTSLLNPNSGTDAVTLKDGTQLIVYNPDVPGKDWFNGRSKLRVATSKDGKKWEDVVILENGTKEEYSYPAIIQTSDGLVHITYTYDRKNVKHIVLKKG
ncbi:Predicted neuraminidase (sialidase) [Pedobacter westerhofensis]|uniref:Predicted neuraminidase (Sialidase) n=1 Tax=Pedobacter westerhofensis TaxID=425512 RepID=A0A521AH86_9SPHI|nr:sialidase family protein [Pedobacter westerhofensis]SMO34166.1 Predicted neuraminidase (sialidase) [Pedobacter westerhofensis]